MTIRCRLCGGYLVSACSRVTVYGTVWGPGCRAQKCHRCVYASSYTDWPCRCNSSPTYSPPPSPDEPPPASGSGGGAQSPTGAGGGAGQTAASTAGAAARGAQGSAPASGLGRSRPGGHTATQTPSSGDHRGLRACAAAAADEMHRQALQPEQQARLRQLQQIADIAEQCGLPRCVATQLEDDWEADGLSGGAALVAELREQLRKDARQSLDVPRLVTALRHFRSFLVETGRVAFHSARGDRPCDSERYNRETLDLFQQWVRRNVRKPCGAALKQDTIAGYSGAIRVFLNREARCDMAPPSTNVAMPSVHKTWRREDGPSGARQLMRGLRASHIFEWRRRSAVGAAMAPAGSTEELERGAVALTSHNLLLRGGEPGKQTNAPIDPQRVITWGSVEWLAPREESQGLPWCIMAVVPIKDMGMRKKAYPCPIQRRHDGPLGADLMCTYDALARFYWARAMPGYPFPVDERGRPRANWWHDIPAAAVDRSQPFFTHEDGSIWTTDDVRGLACEVAVAAGVPTKEVGAKAFRIGGATDWRETLGVAGADVIQLRGRWDSIVATVYQRPLVADQLMASARVGAARGAGLEELCAGFAQQAVARR